MRSIPGAGAARTGGTLTQWIMAAACFLPYRIAGSGYSGCPETLPSGPFRPLTGRKGPSFSPCAVRLHRAQQWNGRDIRLLLFPPFPGSSFLLRFYLPHFGGLFAAHRRSFSLLRLCHTTSHCTGPRKSNKGVALVYEPIESIPQTLCHQDFFRVSSHQPHRRPEVLDETTNTHCFVDHIGAAAV